MSRRDDVEHRAASGEATVENMMAAYSQDAVNHAASLGYGLDYSEESLRKVESILDQLARDRPKGIRKLFGQGPTPEEIETVCKMYGGYIGEVMRFQWGEGEWIIPQDGPFVNALTLKYGEAMTSPPAKVYKRLIDGAGDDVYYYYLVLNDRSKGTLP